MKLNPSFVLTLFLIVTIVFVGASEQQVDAATFFFDEYRIDVHLQPSLWNNVEPHGFLDLIDLNSNGELELREGIQELSFTDSDGMKVPWEEAKPILWQALMRNFNEQDQAPYSLSDWVLPISEFTPVTTDSGHNFDLINVAATLNIGDFIFSPNFKELVKHHESRVKLFKTAILRAVVMEQTHYFFKEVLNDHAYATALETGLKITELVDDTAELIDDIAARYVRLRIQDGTTQVTIHNQPEAVKKLIGPKVIERFNKTFRGKIAKGARVVKGGRAAKVAGKLLTPISIALEAGVNIADEIERHNILYQLRNDLVILLGLNNMMLLMESLGDADPAMIEGVEAALYELANLSEWRWSVIGKGF